jgi:hypothetical protein
MSCIAGLWWSQTKRMCLSPLEVSSCNPYKIINDIKCPDKKVSKNGNNLDCSSGLTCDQIGISPNSPNYRVKASEHSL